MLPTELTVEAITAALLAVLAFVARTALRFARSPEGRALLRIMRKHGVKAALAARAELVHQVKAAHARDSDGGVAVTPEERTRIARSTVKAFMHSLDVGGLLVAAADAFGGVEKMEAEMIKRFEEKMDNRLGG